MNGLKEVYLPSNGKETVELFESSAEGSIQHGADGYADAGNG